MEKERAEEEETADFTDEDRKAAADVSVVSFVLIQGIYHRLHLAMPVLLPTLMLPWVQGGNGVPLT